MAKAIPKDKTLNSSQKTVISLVTPIYNESRHLERFLKMIDALPIEPSKELVFIDDSSKDNSYEILSKFPFKSKVLIHKQEKNQGKGAALRKGFELASGEILIVQDADFEYDMEEIQKLIDPVIAGKADVVYGSRFRKEGHQVHRTFHYLINRILTLLSNILSGMYVSDMETCYKVFKSVIIKNINLESNRFGFEPEVTAKLARLKLRVQEHPISYYPRNYLEGKKITWKDGVAALRHIFYFNLFANKKRFYKDTMPEQFIPKDSNWL